MPFVSKSRADQTRRDSLLKQFQAMENILAKLQGATGFLNQQSSNLSK